jgi:hypothetical protein
MMDILFGLTLLVIAGALVVLAGSARRYLNERNRRLSVQNGEYRALITRLYSQASHNIQELGMEDSDATAEYVKAEIENTNEKGRLELL